VQDDPQYNGIPITHWRGNPECSESERYQVFLHAKSHPKASQRDLAKGFCQQFNKDSLQLRKIQRQPTITSYFQVNAATEHLYREAAGAAGGAGAMAGAEEVVAAEEGRSSSSGLILHVCRLIEITLYPYMTRSTYLYKRIACLGFSGPVSILLDRFACMSLPTGCSRDLLHLPLKRITCQYT